MKIFAAVILLLTLALFAGAQAYTVYYPVNAPTVISVWNPKTKAFDVLARLDMEHKTLEVFKTNLKSSGHKVVNLE